ncbi:MAG: DUF72 domain-containing protein [Candidatus Thermoplasmatota archaeon]|nr:DUF72 domain-containing protein [Candidatus Thermoplasmatota archaeon]
MGSIRIGNSGWSYKDWIGPFYPGGTSSRDMLGIYFSRFDIVEVNSTFYDVPKRSTVEAWARECSRWEGREITIKIPRVISHDMTMDEDASRMVSELVKFEKAVLMPLDDAGVLGAVLFQASPYFTVRGDIKYKARSRPMVPVPGYILGMKRLKEISECLRSLPGEPAIELRNSSWLNEELGLRREAVDILLQNGVTLVTVDGPSFPWLSEETSRYNYIRFHGRNKEGWFRTNESDPSARYDHCYTDEELLSREEEIRIMASKVGNDTRIFFNNHPRGMAPKNASRLKEMLGIPDPIGAFDRFW